MTEPTLDATVREIHLEGRSLGCILTIDQTDTLLEAAAVMTKHDVGSLLVLGKNRKVVGIVTERDFIAKALAQGVAPARTQVRVVMTANVVSCTMDTPITTVRRLMAAHHVRHLPVIEDGVPMGMISSRDILAFELARTMNLARQQSALLHRIETEHPEVVAWRRDPSGRILIE